jgi:hypothetical protein
MPVFDINKNHFEFTGESKFETEEDAKEKIKSLTKSEEYKFFSVEEGNGYRTTLNQEKNR